MGARPRSLVTVRKTWIYFMLAILVPVFGASFAQQQPDPQQPTTDRQALLLNMQGPIGPATAEFLTSSLNKASERNSELLIIRMDTPGGLDASTRDIVQAILNSPVPVATFVSPGGARAASAGTYILLASHIAAMAPATNVGAATPVSIIGDGPAGRKQGGGEEEEESETSLDAADTMTRKAVNDSVAYIRGLAARHGRNADWAEQAVREADSITAEKALEIGVIDLLAKDLADLLEQVNGRTVEVQGRSRVMETSGLVVEELEPDWKTELLAVITSPTIAYLLLLIGVYGLIFEGYNPGAVFPGVIGAICLLVALYAFQMLPVNYAGFALLVLGIILMIGEAVAPSFGALGIGGIISVVIGSIILIDTDVPGFMVSRPLIGAIALVSSFGLMAIIGVAVKARQRPVVAGREELLAASGTTLSDFERREDGYAGEVFVHSERWHAVSGSPLQKGEAIRVTAIDGLVLEVQPADV